MQNFQLEKKQNIYKINFFAMASPCEVLLYTEDQALVEKIAQQVIAETRRIENKYSRYRQGNLCWRMNHSKGEKVAIDQETYFLLTYAKNLFELSQKCFDITSGVLRKAWRFESGSKPPSAEKINKLLPYIGFEKINFDEEYFCLPELMEIDFGGIGKEYCVDQVAELITPICQQNGVSFLINFGGDLRAGCFDDNHSPWIVGVEGVVDHNQMPLVIEVSQGSIATSGTNKRMFEFNKKRYTHILNPKTGYPIENTPISVSVFANSCSLAGGMSTLAMLQGEDAENFLKENKVKHICCWP